MIDSHAHLHDAAFDDDRADTIARARASGVHDIITVGTDLTDSARAIAVAREFGLAVAIGIHPHEAEQAPTDLDAAFAPLLASAERCVAIGEIGLDYHYEHSPRDVQRRVLLGQLELADRYDLPVIFHEREAGDDFVEVLREDAQRRQTFSRPTLRGVIHCFTRDLVAAKVYTEEFGLYLGIGGVLTFKTAQTLRDAISTIGLERIILETDCPYLAPVPHRGKRNEPSMMQQTAEKLAELVAKPTTEIIAITTKNTKALFAL